MTEWLPRRHRKAVAWISGILVLILAGLVVTGYGLLRHLNGNIQQVNISGLLGRRPANPHPKAENIALIGSDTRQGANGQNHSGLVTDQSDTLIVIHIPASRKWAEVMSIPRDSYVRIPSCTMGDGQLSSPTQFKINEAFALGNLYGNHTALGAACTIKTVEQDTGIYISHFIVVNFTGFQNMVAALNGVQECNPVAFTDPSSGIVLSAGYHWLNPAQALAYVRARHGLGDGSDLERIVRQQAFMSSLIHRARSELYNPLAIYRFLDAATSAITIDSQLGGITGLYDLEQSLHGIPSSKIAFFTLPNFPRGEVVPSDTANVLWKQPEDSEIFASLRADVPASAALFSATTVPQQAAVSGRPGKFGVLPSASPEPEHEPWPRPDAAADPGAQRRSEHLRQLSCVLVLAKPDRRIWTGSTEEASVGHARAPHRGMLRAAQALSCDQVTAEVVTAMRGAGIEAIVLKGPSIARWLYPDGGRSYADTDILVQYHDVDRAARVLRRLGFGELLAAFHQAERSADDVETTYIRHDGAGSALVDLHHNLPELPVPDEALWQEFSAGTETIRIGGIDARCLGRTALALHVVLHAAQHGYGGHTREDLTRAIAVLSPADWRRTADLAERLGIVDIFGASLRHEGIGAGVADELGVPGREIADSPFWRSFAPRGSAALAQFRAARTVRQKARQVRWALLPSPAKIRYVSRRPDGSPLSLPHGYARWWRDLALAGVHAGRYLRTRQNLTRNGWGQP